MASLYVSGYDTEVHLDSKCLDITRQTHDAEKQRLRVPLFDVDRAVFVGRVNTHLGVIHCLLKRNVPISFVSGRGKLLGTVQPPHNGNALLRLRQYELAGNEPFARSISERLIYAKIRNSRRVLQRLSASREMPIPEVQSACDRLQRMFNETSEVSSIDELRGIEGHCAAIYFSALSKFFPEELPFVTRSRRPPADEANALLSWTYTILLSEFETAICGAGLDICLGFLHGIAYGRPSLALDLIEPYRAPLADLLVLHILNHKILKKDNFERSEDDGGVRLKKDCHKKFFLQYETVMQRLFSRTKGGQHVTFRDCIRQDVYSLASAMQKGTHMQPFIMP